MPTRISPFLKDFIAPPAPVLADSDSVLSYCLVALCAMATITQRQGGGETNTSWN
jgi:hypothetical protein